MLSVPGEIIEGHADLGADNEFSETQALGQKKKGEARGDLRPKATAKGSAKITVSSDILVSATAKAAIEKAGGSFAVNKPVAKPVVEKKSKQNGKR